MPPGPRPKPAERRQRRNEPKKGSLTAVIPPESPKALPVPPACQHWSPRTKASWKALWGHALVQAVDRDVHLEMTRRLFDLRDEREKLSVIVRANPVVEGSQGQERAHPLYGRLGTVEGEILALEKEMGLTPKAALDLGLQFNEVRKSLDDLARSAGGDEELDEEDPRLAGVPTTKAKVIDAKVVEDT